MNDAHPEPPHPATGFLRAPGRLGSRTLGIVARGAGGQPLDPAVVEIDPDFEVTPASFNLWLDERQSGEPLNLDVSAAETLADARAAGEV